MRPNAEIALRVQFLLDQLEARMEAERARGKHRRQRLRRLTFGLLPASPPPAGHRRP
ncbi:MAG TPA: hypothetical protein VFA30_09835 [Gaiellaceae bacterium]|nr:hypothetical protein [Gaiellaceae bacterium]